MATKIYEFKGTVKWAKVYEPDEFRGAVRWTLNFYPEDLLEFKKTGIQTRAKSDEDGEFYSLRRDTTKVIKGEIVVFCPPVIYDADGTPLVSYKNAANGTNVYSFNKSDNVEVIRDGDPFVIGNGSTIKLKVAVFDTSMGKGHRMESIKILDLVEYVKPDDSNNDVSSSDVPVEQEEEIEVKPAPKSEPGKRKLPW